MRVPVGAPPARQLLPLVLAVLVAHAVLLRLAPRKVVSAAPSPAAFFTREIAPPPAPSAPPTPSPAVARERTVPRSGTQAAHTSRPAPSPSARAEPAPAAVTTNASPLPVPTPPSDVQHANVQALPPPAPSAEPLSAVPPHRAAIPEPVRLHYEVRATYRGLPVDGQAQLWWRHDGNQYEARLEVGAPGLPTRVQTSNGIVTSEGLQPLRFSEKSRTEQATHFQRDKGKVTFSSNAPDAQLLGGEQDRLSVVIQLSAMIGGEPARYPPGASIAIPTAGTRDAENWVFTVEGEEDLDLPAGKLRALKLQRLPRKEYDVKVELWLAPRLDYAPVRLRLTNPNGDSVDQRWSSTDKG